MTRKYIPDPAALATALAGRVDVLENDARQTRTDVSAIGRGLGELTAQIRTYTAATHLATATETPIEDVETDDDAGAVQPDWLTVDDPATAQGWLLTLAAWLERVGTHHGLTPIEPCWPLHPDVVALLLALQYERGAAYDGQRPTPVTEWLTRWLPATITAVAAALGTCTAEHAHRVHGRTYKVAALDHGAVATWWTTDRDTPARIALNLPPL